MQLREYIFSLNPHHLLVISNYFGPSVFCPDASVSDLAFKTKIVSTEHKKTSTPSTVGCLKCIYNLS